MSMAAKSPQLNLEELLRLKWLLGGAMAMVALWTVFFLDIEALALVASAGALLACVQIWPQLPGRVPTLAWRLAVPAIVVAAVVDFYRSPDTLPVFIRLAILLVLYRALAYRRRREDLQLIVLSLFLIVVAGVLTVSLGFAFLLLGFTACALGFLFVINLIEAGGGYAPPDTEGPPAWTRLRWSYLGQRLRAVADWRLLVFAGVLFFAVVGLSALLFLLIPRFEMGSGFFLDRYITRQSRSGFTDTIRFGDVTDFSQDTGVAMRVDLSDSGTIHQAPYWRLVALDEYTSDGFRVSAGVKAALVRSERIAQQERGTSFGRRDRAVVGTWTFYVEPGVSRYLPLPGNFGTLRLRDPSRLQSSAAQRILALRTEALTMIAFQLEDVDLEPTIPDPRFAGFLRQADSVRPEASRVNPRLLLRAPEGAGNTDVLERIVGEITAGQSVDAAEFARRATAWIQARHTYTLGVRIPVGPGDGIVRWLDSREPGYCEYFAAGLTVLSRAAGFPARVAVGFRGGVLNTFENYYMVRNSDAHAWVEIYDGKSAWMRFDPTPSARGGGELEAASGAVSRSDSSWSARFDSLRILWYRRIVNFDSRQQVEMLDQVKSFTADSGQLLRQRLVEWARQVKEWANQPWSGTRLARVAGSLLGLLLVGWLLVRAFRSGVTRRGRRRRGDREEDRIRREAGVWLERLREHGPERRVIADLQRLRFGHRQSWPEPRQVFQQARAARRRRPQAPVT